MSTHTLWCAAHNTPTEEAAGRTPGRCTCKGPQPPDTKTRPLFPELECPTCGGVDHPPERCPKRAAPQLKLF